MAGITFLCFSDELPDNGFVAFFGASARERILSRFQKKYVPVFFCVVQPFPLLLSFFFLILRAARIPVENAAWRLYPPVSPSMSSTSPAK